MKPELSIIIPTHERADILRRCLHHLATQTIAGRLEVIVVSDGHDPATEKLCNNIPHPEPILNGVEGVRIPHCLFLEIPKSQQGVARNVGVQHATSPFVLFIGDDIFLESHACAVHLEAQKQRTQGNAQGVACLGYTTWDPAIGVTAVMRWLEESGWQFGYPLLQAYHNKSIPQEQQHRFTYTSHISLPTTIAKTVPFREDVTLYGWEDIEWGSRLKKAGIPLIFIPEARAVHHHHITLESSLRRMEILGASAVTMEQAVPGFDRMPRGWKRCAYACSALLPTMAGRHRRAFLEGMRNAQRTNEE